ncbi:unnamed protein product [Clonostachys byssicola]|uniref:Uncharacterized protein n=1 Tax=Clonostachys byssicola TaxID=160290 RepID=A0A9N9UVN3_9HYPO|nr:unnamed protein product [Clonostachys byssicola]
MRWMGERDDGDLAVARRTTKRTDASGLQSTRPDPSKLHQGMEAVAWHLAESVLGRHSLQCVAWGAGAVAG